MPGMPAAGTQGFPAQPAQGFPAQPAQGFPAPAAQSFPSPAAQSFPAQPAQGFPAASPQAEPAEPETPPGPSPAAQKKKKLMLVGVIAGGVLTLVGLAAVGAILIGGGGSGGSSSVAADAPEIKVPDGYKKADVMSVVCLLPDGDPVTKLPPDREFEAVEDFDTGNYFILCVEKSFGKEPDKLNITGMKKHAARMVGGEVLGGAEMERNGYKGIKGMLDQSLFVPKMQVEIFDIDGRFIVLGYSTEQMRAGGAPNGEAAKQIDTVLDSLQINKYSGGLFW